MDEDTYRRCLHYARRVLPPDPAIEAEDLVHSAYIKARAFLALDKPEAERVAYLCRAISTVATSARRGSRGRGLAGQSPIAEWTPWGGSVEGEALARVVLGALLAAAHDGEAFATAAIAVALHGSREAADLLGVPQTTLLTRQYRLRKREGLEA